MKINNMKKSIIFSGVLFSLLFAGIFLFVIEVKVDIMGDANGDCNVDILDLVFVRNKLGRDINILDNRKADVNGDGRIDILDFVFVRNHLGETCPSDPGPHQIIDLEPGWNVISTPKVISSYEFSVPETAEYLDIRLLDSSFPSGWATMQEIGQTKFEPLYGYFVYNKTNELQTLRLNYDDDLTPDQRLFKRTLQPGWNTIGIANPNYALQQGTGNIDTDNVSKILDSIIDSTGLVIDFSAYEEDLDSVKMGDFWASKIASQVNDLNDFRELKGYGVSITKTTDYTGFQDIGKQVGSLHVSKSADTPPTGNTAVGDDVVLGVFDFDVRVEEMKITAISVDFTAPSLAASDITSVSLYDKNDYIVAGPKDVNHSLTADFTDTFIVPVGISSYTVKATLADNISNGITIYSSILDPSNYIIAKGMTSNESINATPTVNVDANIMTIMSPVLTVTTLASPAGRSIPAGASDFVWATFSLDAGVSGEDIQITTIIVTDIINDVGLYNDIDNAELWVDLTDGNSSRGDIYETKVSDTEQFSAINQAFTLNQIITIPKRTFVRMAFVADLCASTESGGSHSFRITSGIVANGATTGSIASITYNISNAQIMTVIDKGNLTVTRDSSTPISGIVIGAKTAILGVFRLSANNVEDLDLDKITLTILNGNYIDTLYFYEGDTLLGSIPGNNEPTKYFEDLTLIIPANGNRKITVKAKLFDVDGAVVKNDTPIKVSLDTINAVETTGFASGESIKSGSQIVYGNKMYIYESRPYVTVNADTPTTTALIPSTSTLVAIFDVTADEGKKISFINASGLDANNSLTVQVAAQINDTVQDQLVFTLKDIDGNTLDSNVLAADSNSTKVMNTSVTFLFDSYAAGFNVTAGQTKQLKVYLDTTDFDLDTANESNAIRLWLDDSANDIDWGINGSGSFNLGNLIFRGDMYAKSLSNSN